MNAADFWLKHWKWLSSLRLPELRLLSIGLKYNISWEDFAEFVHICKKYRIQF